MGRRARFLFASSFRSAAPSLKSIEFRPIGPGTCWQCSGPIIFKKNEILQNSILLFTNSALYFEKRDGTRASRPLSALAGGVQVKYSSWWGFRPRKITNVFPWREFHCLVAPQFTFQESRRALARGVIRRKWATWPRLAATKSEWWTTLDRTLSGFVYVACSSGI